MNEFESRQMLEEVIFWRSIARKVQFWAVTGWMYAFLLMAVIVYMD